MSSPHTQHFPPDLVLSDRELRNASELLALKQQFQALVQISATIPVSFVRDLLRELDNALQQYIVAGHKIKEAVLDEYARLRTNTTSNLTPNATLSLTSAEVLRSQISQSNTPQNNLDNQNLNRNTPPKEIVLQHSQDEQLRSRIRQLEALLKESRTEAGQREELMQGEILELKNISRQQEAQILKLQKDAREMTMRQIEERTDWIFNRNKPRQGKEQAEMQTKEAGRQ